MHAHREATGSCKGSLKADGLLSHFAELRGQSSIGRAPPGLSGAPTRVLRPLSERRIGRWLRLPDVSTSSCATQVETVAHIASGRAPPLIEPLSSARWPPMLCSTPHPPPSPRSSAGAYLPHAPLLILKPLLQPAPARILCSNASSARAPSSARALHRAYGGDRLRPDSDLARSTHACHHACHHNHTNMPTDRAAKNAVWLDALLSKVTLRARSHCRTLSAMRCACRWGRRRRGALCSHSVPREEAPQLRHQTSNQKQAWRFRPKRCSHSRRAAVFVLVKAVPASPAGHTAPPPKT